MKTSLIKCFGKQVNQCQVHYQNGYETITGNGLEISVPCFQSRAVYPLSAYHQTTGKELHVDDHGHLVIDGLVTAITIPTVDSAAVAKLRDWSDAGARGQAAIDLTATHRSFAALLALASTDEARPNLCGVWIDGSRLITSDGHRLAMYRNCVTNTVSDSLLIPIAACKAIVAQRWKQFTVYPGKDWSMACNGDDGVIVSWSNAIADMPAFDRVIPTEFNGQVTVTMEHLALATKVKAPVIRYNGNVEFWPHVDRCAKGYKPGPTALLAVDEKMVSGITDPFGINAGYLRSIHDVLGFGKSDAMVGTIKDLCSAFVFRSNDDLALVMPIARWE